MFEKWSKLATTFHVVSYTVTLLHRRRVTSDEQFPNHLESRSDFAIANSVDHLATNAHLGKSANLLIFSAQNTVFEITKKRSHFLTLTAKRASFQISTFGYQGILLCIANAS